MLLVYKVCQASWQRLFTSYGNYKSRFNYSTVLLELSYGKLDKEITHYVYDSYDYSDIPVLQ